jgi:hypothetical protein
MPMQALTTLPLPPFGEWVFCPRCGTYLRADFVIYWALDPRPRCAKMRGGRPVITVKSCVDKRFIAQVVLAYDRTEEAESLEVKISAI